MSDVVKILIAGDTVIPDNFPVDNVISEGILNMFRDADIKILNLEAPVTSSTEKLSKTGPHLKNAKANITKMLRALSINVVTLANNHVLDYGAKGLEDTLAFLKKEEVRSVGAGMDLEAASKTLYYETNQGLIAIVNFAENEWASATENSSGANPMDVIDNSKQIEIASRKARFVLVIIHGGHEYYNLPSPRIQKQYRHYAECGASIVIGHHTHCISGYEMHNGIPIFYSLGNFLFPKKTDSEEWRTGLIAELILDSRGKLSVQPHPIKQELETFKLQLLVGEDKIKLLKHIEEYNSVIEDKGMLRKEWEEFIDKRKLIYLNYLSPINFIRSQKIRNALIKFKLDKVFINRYHLRLLLNLLQCETHLDSSKQVIRREIKRIKNDSNLR